MSHILGIFSMLLILCKLKRKINFFEQTLDKIFLCSSNSSTEDILPSFTVVILFRTKTVNYMDPNYNVSMPIFSIHGNHDDPSGVCSTSPPPFF